MIYKQDTLQYRELLKLKELCEELEYYHDREETLGNIYEDIDSRIKYLENKYKSQGIYAEDNNIIAKYIGQYDESQSKYKMELRDNIYFVDTYNMQFNSSWDWLMPVVDKIKNKSNLIFSIESYNGGSKAILSREYKSNYESYGKNDILAAYNVVVKALKERDRTKCTNTLNYSDVV